MKEALKKIVYNKYLGEFVLKLVLKVHTKAYNISGGLSSYLNNGIHPKHKIMRYKEWFLDNINRKDVVLDVGSNTGMMAELISYKVSYVYGIEIDCNLVKAAINKRPNSKTKFICADATSYDYSKCRKIDCVILSNVLEHIEHRVLFLKKLSTQIKWNGSKIFLIRVPMIDREWITVFKKELGLEYRLDNTHYIEYTYKEFKAELNEADFEITSYHVRFGEIYAICIAK
jgi:2-polyprenyl-3-methyl-5-hydroxy-6-metoxy-1,4-benzoquinol methylase